MAVERLSQNDEVRDIISRLKGETAQSVNESSNSSGNSSGSESLNSSGGESDNKSGENQSFKSGDMSGIFNLITPEMVNLLPNLMSSLGTGSLGTNNELAEKGEAEHHGHKASAQERKALLSAIRPFMNENRRKALDIMIGIEKLGLALPNGLGRKNGDK